MERNRDQRCPVSLDQIKEWNYIEDAVFDEKLRLCVKAAIAGVENYINQVVWISDFAETFPGVPRVVPMPLGPIVSVAVTVDGQALSPELYVWDAYFLTIDPSVQGESTTVTVRAGYDDPDEDIKSAVLLIASELFRNPTDSVKQLPTTSKLLLDPHRKANI